MQAAFRGQDSGSTRDGDKFRGRYVTVVDTRCRIAH